MKYFIVLMEMFRTLGYKSADPQILVIYRIWDPAVDPSLQI